MKSGIRALETVLIKYAIDIEDHNVNSVIVHSDSEHLVEASTVMIPQWQPHYVLHAGRVMEDRMVYERLSELVGIFHVQGIKVYFDKVREVDNNWAVDLAFAALVREPQLYHYRHAWVSSIILLKSSTLINKQMVVSSGTSICHDRELFTNYQPTLLSHFDELQSGRPTQLVILGRGIVRLEVVLCDGRQYTLTVPDVFHCSTATINIFAPAEELIRPGFLINRGEALNLIQDTHIHQMVLKLAHGPQTLYPPEVRSEMKSQLLSNFGFIRGEKEPPRLPPVPQNPRPIAYALENKGTTATHYFPKLESSEMQLGN